jgi:hypothetical protein
MGKLSLGAWMKVNGGEELTWQRTRTTRVFMFNSRGDARDAAVALRSAGWDAAQDVDVVYVHVQGAPTRRNPHGTGAHTRVMTTTLKRLLVALVGSFAKKPDVFYADNAHPHPDGTRMIYPDASAPNGVGWPARGVAGNTRVMVRLDKAADGWRITSVTATDPLVSDIVGRLGVTDSYVGGARLTNTETKYQAAHRRMQAAHYQD